MNNTSFPSILVLGAGGAIGSAVVAQAIAAGMQVDATVRPGGDRSRLPLLQGSQIHPVDLANSVSLEAVLIKTKPTVVVMAAVPPAHPGPTRLERELALQRILGMQFTLFEALDRSGCRAPIILIGSSTVYGAGMVRVPLGPMRPQNMRGVAKAAEWILAQQLAAEQSRALIELRVFCAYGRWMRKDRLLTRALQAALTGRTVQLARSPLPRDWIHHDDIGRAVVQAGLKILQHTGSQAINLCSGSLMDCHEVIRRVEVLCGRSLVDPTPFSGGDRMGDVLAGIPPTEQELPGWKIQVEFENGLQDLWQWALSQEGQQYLIEDRRHG